MAWVKASAAFLWNVGVVINAASVALRMLPHSMRILGTDVRFRPARLSRAATPSVPSYVLTGMPVTARKRSITSRPKACDAPITRSLGPSATGSSTAKPRPDGGVDVDRDVGVRAVDDLRAGVHARPDAAVARAGEHDARAERAQVGGEV